MDITPALDSFDLHPFHMHLFNVLAYTDLTYMICICYIFIFLNIKKHKNML